MFRPAFPLLFSALLAFTACQNDMHTPTSANTRPVSGIGRPSGIDVIKLPDSGAFLLKTWGGTPAGNALTDGDRKKDAQAERRACNAPIGQKVTWNNPDSGISGTIVAVGDGYNAAGSYCRDFVQAITVTGHEQQKPIKACQRPDGSWGAVP